MRKIKFRGKSIDSGEWLYGSLLRINDESYIYPENYGDLNDIDFGRVFKKVFNESVGQLTEFTDKNSKDIFEDDLLIIKNIGIAEVYFDEGSFATYNKDDDDELLRDIWKEDMEIIGNKFENKNLIKQYEN